MHLGFVNSAAFASPERLLNFLSREERERADRFRFDEDRRTYIVGRGLLRVELAKRLGCNPSHVELGYGEHGKPYLLKVSGLEFNLAHSRSWIFIGLASGRAIGVDLESYSERTDQDAIARRCFHPEETRWMMRERPVRPLAFYEIWTCKEAIMKACGRGISLGLDTFCVRPGAEFEEIELRDQPNQCWSLRLIAPPAEGFAAALALQGKRADCELLDIRLLELGDF